MKNLNLQNVTAKTGGGFADVEPGGYICRIVNVTDKPEKEYLMVDLDIAAGEFKNYYQDAAARTGYWLCTQYWSYKEANLPYFKGNLQAVEESSRQGWTFEEGNERSLIGQLVGAVFGEEEYRNRDGEIKTTVRPRFLCSTKRIMEMDFSIPKKKLYDPARDKRNAPAAPSSGSGGSYLDPMMKDLDEDDGELLF